MKLFRPSLGLTHRTILATPIRGVKSLEDRKQDKEKKQFQDEIQYFLSKDSFTLYDFHERVG